jgi:hypothetical protein
VRRRSRTASKWKARYTGDGFSGLEAVCDNQAKSRAIRPEETKQIKRKLERKRKGFTACGEGESSDDHGHAPFQAVSLAPLPDTAVTITAKLWYTLKMSTTKPSQYPYRTGF